MLYETGMLEIQTSLTQKTVLWTMHGAVQQLLNMVNTRLIGGASKYCCCCYCLLLHSFFV